MIPFMQDSIKVLGSKRNALSGGSAAILKYNVLGTTGHVKRCVSLSKFLAIHLYRSSI